MLIGNFILQNSYCLFHSIIIYLQCSYHLSTAVFQGAPVPVERGPRLYGYGADSSRTNILLQYLSRTLGPLTSFTGTHQTNQWTLTVNETYLNVEQTFLREPLPTEGLCIMMYSS